MDVNPAAANKRHLPTELWKVNDTHESIPAHNWAQLSTVLTFLCTPSKCTFGARVSVTGPSYRPMRHGTV
jgi:hypothetical protein